MVLRRGESTLRSAQVNTFLDYLCRMILPARGLPLAVAERTRCTPVTATRGRSKGRMLCITASGDAAPCAASNYVVDPAVARRGTFRPFAAGFWLAAAL